MTSSSRLRTVCSVGTLLVGLLFASCIENGKSFVIMFAMFPEEETCELQVQSDGSFAYSSAGQLDLNHPFFNGQPYFNLGAQVHNYILANPTGSEEGGNINVLLQRYEVKYRWIVGTELLQNNPAALAIEDLDFSMATTGFVSGASSVDDPGQTVFSGTVLPKEVGSVLRTIDPQVVEGLILALDLRLYGQTTGGDAVTSNRFRYPLYFCWGCQSVAATCWPGQVSIAGSGSSPSCTTISNVIADDVTVGQDFEIRWNSGGGEGLVDIFVQCGDPSSNRMVASRTSNDGSYNWNVPGPASTSCTLIVECSSDGSNSDTSRIFRIDD